MCGADSPNRIRASNLDAMVARQLVFYRWASIERKPPFEHHHAFGQLAKRIADDPDVAILTNDDISTAATVVAAGTPNDPAKVQLLALRSADNRPSQWKPGQPLGPLPLLDGQYPADVTHVMVWPDGIAAQDLHRNAPRLGRLSYYLRQQVNAYVSFEPLYQPNMRERLEELRGRFRAVELAMTRPEYVNRDSGAFRTLIPAAFGEQAPSVGVHIGVGRRGPRDRFLDGATEEAVFQIAEDAHDQVDRLVVAGRNRTTGRIERVNLLSERLQAKLDIPARPDVPALPDETQVFKALDETYLSFRNQGLFERAVQAQTTHSR